MNIRRIISLTAFLSFFIVLLTSIILYIAPPGRVAYWANWQLWHLSKDQWSSIHVNIGFLFLLSLLLHIYYNWKPIVSYLKNKTKQLKLFTREFNAALALIIIFILGTYVEIPPFSTIIKISAGFEDAAARKYGEPPYGHAELSTLKTFAKRMDIDLKEWILLLEKAGYKVESENQILKEVAKNNMVPPQQIYLVMTDSSDSTSMSDGKSMMLPQAPPPGTGNITLADFCGQYNLNVKVMIRLLKEADITSKEDMTIKKIGEINEMSPIDVYDRIKSIAENDK
jgi:hypothetical protein